MKEETKRKWKAYAKIIVPALLVIGYVIYLVVTMNIQKMPKKGDVASTDLENAFAVAMSDNSLLTLNGKGEEADYEWFYSEAAITGHEKTDLTVSYTHEYDALVMEYLQVNEVLGFYFAEDIVLNGYPTLTLKLKDWTSEDIGLYKLLQNELIKLESQPVVNRNEKDRVEVTFQVNETDGIYYLAGGSHNLPLQGQGGADRTTAETKVNKPETKADSQKVSRQEKGSQKKDTSKSSENASDKDSQQSDRAEQSQQQTESGSGKNSAGKKNSGSYVADVKPSGKESKLTAAIMRILSDGSATGQDSYLTDPVPEGKPLPIEPEDVSINYKKTYACTISIDCKTILGYNGEITEGKESYVPSDGWILKKTNVLFYEGESVFDVLLRETQKREIQMEYSMTPIYNSNYIEGIQNLYEFDCGSESGWMYQVNGWYPNYGCSRYLLQEGDVIQWRYTCEYGFDVGCTLLGEK